MDPANPDGPMMATPSFVFGAKSQKRIAVACNLVRYYETTDRALSAANMQ